MICFKDRTFCKTPGCTKEHAYTEKVIKDAERWWGGPGAPIAVAFLCGPGPDTVDEETRGGGAESSPGS